MAPNKTRKLKQKTKPKKNGGGAARHFLLAALFAYGVRRFWIPRVFPYGFPVKEPMEDRAVFAEMDPENDSLRAKHGKLQKIYERVEEGQEPVMKGPETVVFGNDGTLYVLTEEAKLVSLTDFEQKDKVNVTAKATEVVHLGIGRPLGGKFDPDGTLYIADVLLGLTRVRHPEKPGATVELVASSVKLDDGRTSRILYCNDVDIGPKSGMVYFTDSSDIAPERIGTRTWDTLYASKLDYFRGKRTGRLLQYNPKTNEVTVLATGIFFANGVAVDRDETFLMISETFAARQLKYHITGDKQGTVEVMATGLTGYPDGGDCSFTSSLCYAPLPSLGLKLAKKIASYSHPVNLALRTLLMSLPKSVTPKVVPYGGIVEVDPTTSEIRFIQDPDGQDIRMLGGVTVYKDKLYMGSLKNPYIGVYDLS